MQNESGAVVAPVFILMQQKPFKIPESVLVVIHTAGREVLLIERADHPGFWQSVTGSKDAADEPLVETVVREVREETGILIGSPSVPLQNLRDSGFGKAYRSEKG